MYLAARGKRELAGILRRTAGPIVLAARGFLLLKDAAAPLSKGDIVRSLESRFGISLPLVREILAAEDDRVLAERAEEIAFGYLGEVERLCSVSDRTGPGDGA
jgi:hypothetical protein